MEIIIKDKNPDKFGKTRSECEENLRKEWGGSMSDEQLDKLKYLECKEREKWGIKKQYLGLEIVDQVK